MEQLVHELMPMWECWDVQGENLTTEPLGHRPAPPLSYRLLRDVFLVHDSALNITADGSSNITLLSIIPLPSMQALYKGDGRKSSHSTSDPAPF